jgi:hypothetical protein
MNCLSQLRIAHCELDNNTAFILAYLAQPNSQNAPAYSTAVEKQGPHKTQKIASFSHLHKHIA